MKPKEVKSILIAFNSTVGPWALKYPIGNKDLTETVSASKWRKLYVTTF